MCELPLIFLDCNLITNGCEISVELIMVPMKECNIQVYLDSHMKATTKTMLESLEYNATFFIVMLFV